MAPVESQAIPPRPPPEFPSGAASVALGAVVFGVMLVVWAWRQRVLARPAARPAVIPPHLVQFAADVDAKTARLEAVLAAAEARIARLQPGAYLEHAPAREQRPRHEHFAEAANPHQEVYDLADQGLSAVEIARRTQRHTGQIELILNLRRGMSRAS